MAWMSDAHPTQALGICDLLPFQQPSSLRGLDWRTEAQWSAQKHQLAADQEEDWFTKWRRWAPSEPDYLDDFEDNVLFYGNQHSLKMFLVYMFHYSVVTPIFRIGHRKRVSALNNSACMSFSWTHCSSTSRRVYLSCLDFTVFLADTL